MNAITAVRIATDGTLTDVVFQSDTVHQATVHQALHRMLGGQAGWRCFGNRDGALAVMVAAYEFAVVEGQRLNPVATRYVRRIAGPLHYDLELRGTVVVLGWSGQELLSLPDAERAALAAEAGKDTRGDSRSHAGESTRPEEQGEAVCVVCGCTEDAACESGCYWVPNDQMADMCSACAAQLDDLRGPLLRWAESVSLPGGGDGMALVHCKPPAGDPAVLVLSGQWQRAALARTLEIVEVRQTCPTQGCGSTADWDPADAALWGWSRLQVAGVDDAPRWRCSAVCVQEAMARAGAELAAQDRADELGGDL